MKSLKLLLSLRLAFCLVCAAVPHKVLANEILVTVSRVPEKDGAERDILVRVWNCSAREVSVPSGNLPWLGYHLGLVLYAAGDLAGRSFDQSPPISDPMHAMIKIGPNSSLSNVIHLHGRFPGIFERYKNNLVVFWVYDLGLLEKSGTFVGGMVDLSSLSGKDVDPCAHSK